MVKKKVLCVMVCLTVFTTGLLGQVAVALPWGRQILDNYGEAARMDFTRDFPIRVDYYEIEDGVKVWKSFSEYVSTFDDEGGLRKDSNLDDTQMPESIFSFIYEGDLLIEKESLFLSGYHGNYKVQYKYDENLNLIELVRTSGLHSYVSKYFYNPDNTLKKIINDEGELMDEYFYSDGRRVSSMDQWGRLTFYYYPSETEEVRISSGREDYLYYDTEGRLIRDFYRMLGVHPSQERVPEPTEYLLTYDCMGRIKTFEEKSYLTDADYEAGIFVEGGATYIKEFSYAD